MVCIESADLMEWFVCGGGGGGGWGGGGGEGKVIGEGELGWVSENFLFNVKSHM